MYEKRAEALATGRVFARRLLLHGAAAASLIGASLALGVAGYHYLGGLAWLDALVNAAMLLGGMGPVDALHTAPGKLFASCYALYCGLIAVLATGVLLAPVLHRLLHRFHLDDRADR